MRDTIELARQVGYPIQHEEWQKATEEFAALVAQEATEEANRRANASWALMCEKMVAAEREKAKHNEEVLMNALFKACGDNAQVVQETIDSQGELK